MESKAALYNINEKRYTELKEKVKKAGFSDQKTTIIKTALSAFAFTCAQVWGLCEGFTTEDDKLKAISLFKDQIIDPENKQKEIIDKFTFSDGKKKATELLANLTKCKTEGNAPDKFPVLDLPYTSKWSDADLEKLIKDINAAAFSDKKIEVAKTAILASTAGFTSAQAAKLYDAFSFSKDILALTEIIHERLMGVSCEQITTLIKKFSFNDQKLEILKAFKKSILDVENKFTILDAYDFSDTKEEARKILEDLKPKSYLFGVPSGKVVFVIDLSGSMSCNFKVSTGQTFSRLDFVKQELAKTLTSFDESIEFNVLPYADKVIQWKNGLQKATKQSIVEAAQYVNQFKANGGTNAYDALAAAYNTPGVQTIYFLTDGAPSVGAKTNPSAIVEDVKKWQQAHPVKINSIAFLMGTFSADNKPLSRSFMKELADITGGVYRSLESDH